MKLSRVSLFAALTTALVGLAACTEEGALPRSGRHYVPVSMETQQAMRDKGMRSHAPILIRAFKKESELEVWKQDSSGKMALLKTYPMCRWSGQLGPKIREGDRQVPEGFYSVTQGAMNPNSSYYLSFNVGYPNQLDRQLGRTGAHIMVHGDCSSMGCFAMTDNQVSDIYGLTREAFAGGQTQIQMQSLPFRMTPENLAKYRNDPHYNFWKNLKQGSDHFEVAQQEPKISICGGKYAFNADNCAPAAGTEDIRNAVAVKQRQDDIKVAELVSKGTRAVKRVYRDGDMHPVFRESILAQAGGVTPRSVGTTRNGISRTEAIAYTPVEIPVDQYEAHRKKGRSPMQIAELTHHERLQQEQNPKQEEGKVQPVKVELAKVEPAKVEPAKASASATTVAQASPALPVASSKVATTPAASPAATTQPVAALAATPSDIAQKSVFQRVLGSVGLSGQEEAKSEITVGSDGKLQEISPKTVNVPLPPRRQAGVPQTTGPQANVQIPAIITDGQKLAPGTLVGSGFSKLD